MNVLVLLIDILDINTHPMENKITVKQKKDLINPPKNYLLVTFGYNQKYILPYEAGIKMMSCLEVCEAYNTDDYHNPKITPVDSSDGFDMKVMSQEEYLKLKMAHLLQIDVVDLEEK